MNIIVAVDKNMGIGCNGKLLTRIPEDMEFFKKTTLNKIVLMGHSTFKSLPNSKALNGRTNIILTKDKGLAYPGVMVCNSIKDFSLIAQFCNSEDIYIIGGQKIYEQFLPFCEYAYITKIDQTFKADRFFPNIDLLPEWECIEENDQVWGNGVKARLFKYKNNNYKNIVKQYQEFFDPDIFEVKNKVTFYIPLNFKINECEPFVVEILDTVTAYLMPIQFGIGKGDIIEFYNNVKDYSDGGFIDYLRYKKFIVTSDDFLGILVKYSKDNFPIKCFEVSIDFSLFENESSFEEELAFAIKDMCLKKKPYSLGKKIVSQYYDYVIE
jgi:dihydrofolate reductase